MPAFVTNGPDIPESLLEAHEEGRVVFFCGAGISTPAGLPLFKGLVDEIYEQLHIIKTNDENKSYEKEQYDTTLNQLEQRYPGERQAVRATLGTILKPKWRRRGAMTTHRALLQLATDREGSARIVTTNFDRIFQRVITRQRLDIPILEAPRVPIPKPSRWHGLVHLHGVLPDRPDNAALNRLVLSSGDFGLAYLVDRWAARFVSELFRYYIVCFVGYGINDSVLRYMMDAVAADKLLGEEVKESYVFASFQDDKRQETLVEWKAKGVTPLLYEAPKGSKGVEDHSALHNTLEEWSKTYRDGVRGKEMIIAQHASFPPLTSSRSDFAVGRVLWALTDEQAAKHFADLNPVPPLKWLKPLAENQFGHQDLSRFGIITGSNEDEDLHFSVLRRPAPYTHSPKMCIADIEARGSNWDEVMYQLARWLTRHLDDLELIFWLDKNGGQLQEQFAKLIRKRMEKLEQLETESNKENKEKLNRIRADAPKAIPGPLMRTLWRLLLAKRIRPHAGHHSLHSLYTWLSRIKQGEVTPSLRIELREILTPCVILSPRFDWGESTSASSEPSRIKDIVDWELALSGDHVHSALHDQKKISKLQTALPDLLQDFAVLLRDAFDLARELGDAEERRDFSYIYQPSISKHAQNRYFHDWTALIELTRDAWLETVKIDRTQAGYVAEGWWRIPYPVFKRLSLFAAAQHGVISQRQALDWLLEEDCWWLWSGGTQRESIRLLVALAPKLDKSEMAELEHAILKGPPREMFKDNLQPDEWTRIVDRTMWLRLAKVQATGAALSQIATTKLDKLAQKHHPHFQLAEDESDEFPFRMEVGEKRRESIQIPQPLHELIAWLKENNGFNWSVEDDWRKRCLDDIPTTTKALRTLAGEGIWQADHWRAAFQVWSGDQLAKQSWLDMGHVLNEAPNDFIQSSAHALSWWLQSIAKTFEGHEETFLKLCRRILNIVDADIENKEDIEDKADIEDPVERALNHPIGLVTDALLRLWYRESLKDDQGLSERLKPIFTELCDTNIDKFWYGRIFLTAHAIALYRVDHDWATEHLLPLFDWQRSESEARFAWEGFLWAPGLYRPLLSDIKGPMLKTAEYYEQLGKYAEQYATFLTFVALDPGDIFTTEELATTTKRLPPKGLESVAQALTRAFEGTKDQRDEYWHYRLLPYLQKIWPKFRDVITPGISEEFARLCVTTEEKFPDALEELQYCLQPVQDTYFLIPFIHEKKLCERFPADALKFLDMIIGDDAQFLPGTLRECLNDIQQADQELAQNERFIRLDNLFRRRGE